VAAATGAVAYITPARVGIGRGGATKVGETAAGDLLAWLQTTATGQAREALTDLEGEWNAADSQADPSEQLAKLLAQEPALFAELHSSRLPLRPGSKHAYAGRPGEGPLGGGKQALVWVGREAAQVVAQARADLPG